jgi:hypothetical protein
MKNPFLFQVVKMADIGLITVIYASIGLFLAKVFDRFDVPVDKDAESKKTIVQIFFEYALIIFFIGIMTYIVRKFVEQIPSPFDGNYGLEHNRIKELGNVAIFVFTFLSFQDHLKEKTQVLFDRLW